MERILNLHDESAVLKKKLKTIVEYIIEIGSMNKNGKNSSPVYFKV